MGVERRYMRLASMVPFAHDLTNLVEQGFAMKLVEQELMTAYDTLVKVAEAVQCDCRLIHKKRDHDGSWVGIVMIRKKSDAAEALEIRVACTIISLNLTDFLGVGNVDAGKSTLLGISISFNI
jgi:GTPase